MALAALGRRNKALDALDTTRNPDALSHESTSLQPHQLANPSDHGSNGS